MDFLSIDLGTSTIKTGLVSEAGEMLGLVQRESPISLQGNLVEFSLEEGWRRVVSSIREVVKISGVNPLEIGGLSVTCQGQTFVALDGHYRPMRNAIVWLDRRAVKERDEILATFQENRIYNHTGIVLLSPGMMICCLGWMRSNEPEIYQQARYFVHIADYIIYRLSGQLIAERAIYYCSGLYDITADTWWMDMFDYLDLSPSKLPPLFDSPIPISTLTPQAAHETGLNQKTQVVSGALDVVASVVGAGAITEDKVMLNLGSTMQTMMTIFDLKQLLPKRKVSIFGHVLVGANVGVLWRETAGFSLRWFRDAFCGEEMKIAAETGINVYDLILSSAEKIPAGSDGLLFLPNLQGTMLPESHPEARGVSWGISPSHTKAHFVRAILEGNAYMLRENLEIMKQLGFIFSEIIATGGGTRNRLWNQINADVTGISLQLLKCNDSSVLGAAIFAACGTGLYASIAEGCLRMVHKANLVTPDPFPRPVYDEGYRCYKTLFQVTTSL
jgi:sugar (pentulose or hexulose) kinase